jgi:hypothetical protein
LLPFGNASRIVPMKKIVHITSFGTIVGRSRWMTSEADAACRYPDRYAERNQNSSPGVMSWNEFYWFMRSTSSKFWALSTEFAPYELSSQWDTHLLLFFWTLSLCPESPFWLLERHQWHAMVHILANGYCFTNVSGTFLIWIPFVQVLDDQGNPNRHFWTSMSIISLVIMKMPHLRMCSSIRDG